MPAALIMPRLLGLNGLVYCKSAASLAALLLSLMIGLRAMNVLDESQIVKNKVL